MRHISSRTTVPSGSVISVFMDFPLTVRLNVKTTSSGTVKMIRTEFGTRALWTSLKLKCNEILDFKEHWHSYYSITYDCVYLAFEIGDNQPDMLFK